MIGRPRKIPYDQALGEFEELLRTAPLGHSYSLAGYARRCHLLIDEVIALCWKHKLHVIPDEKGFHKQARAYVTVDTVLYRRERDKK